MKRGLCRFPVSKKTHFSWDNFVTTTSCNIKFKVGRPIAFELQSYAAPHDAHTIDGIDYCFNICRQNIPLSKFYHDLLIIPVGLNINGWGIY